MQITFQTEELLHAKTPRMNKQSLLDRGKTRVCWELDIKIRDEEYHSGKQMNNAKAFLIFQYKKL